MSTSLYVMRLHRWGRIQRKEYRSSEDMSKVRYFEILNDLCKTFSVRVVDYFFAHLHMIDNFPEKY